MKTKLSPYTIASNCTDLTDIRDGINEIQDEMKGLFPRERMFRLSSIHVCRNYRPKGKKLNRKTRFT